MGQLDILTAQSIAAEREVAVINDANHRQVANGHTVAITIRPGRRNRTATLLARLGLHRESSAA